MGASQSTQVPSEDEEEEEEEEEEEDEEDEQDHHNVVNERRELGMDNLAKKILKQEPETLPCHEPASPLTPQLSNFGTPRLGPSFKIWDSYDVLAPPSPPPPPPPARSFTCDPLDIPHHRGGVIEVYLICHGECLMNLRPDLVGGRCPEAALTPNGKRQARALAAFLKSRGIHFNAVYTSSLDRARATAVSVCQEMDFSENQIQSSEALLDMSQGHWEGCQSSEILTPETISSMERFQPDFCAPSGESLRQVEFRMVQFLNGIVISLPEKFRSEFSPLDHSESLSSRSSPNSIHNSDGAHVLRLHSETSPNRHRKGMSRKKAAKSRLQIVTSTSIGDHEADDEMSPRQPVNHDPPHLHISVRSIPSSPTSCIGIFTHSVPIKCLITGLLGCSPIMSHKICIEDSSVTVLQHSWKTGWQIKRLNDTTHLRLV